MEKKKKLIILGVILLLIIVSGATFAILTWNSTMIKLGINTNCFTIDYTRGGDITGSLKLINWGDIYSEENNTFTIKKGMGLSYVNVGINSNCSIEGYGTIYLNVTELSDTFKDGGESSGALKYAVLKNTSNLSNNDIKVDNLDSQSFELLNIEPIMETGKIELYSEQLSNTEIYKYIIVIYIDNNLAGNDITSATFKGNISVEAEQERYGATPDYCFTLSDRDDTNMTASIASTGYKCYEGNSNGYETITDVNIPRIIDGYTITKIGGGAFCTTYEWRGGVGDICTSNVIKLTSVTIPNTVKIIEKSAFQISQLSKVSIPDSVTSIKQFAFSDNQLTSITIPESVTTIGGNAFSDNQLTRITIPNSVTTIGNGAFNYNNLNYVYIGNNSKLTSIGYQAFSSSNRTSTYKGITYVDSPNLKKIYYNGSNQLSWIYTINGSDSDTKFVTGIVPSYTISNDEVYNEVLITTGK